jgi:signal transduction histidine kinase
VSLKKKIVLTFFISAFLVGILAVFEYANFVAIRSEIRFLELTDSIRSKSLQLRRHEKNFFLYGPDSAAEEAREIRRYLDELGAISSDPATGTKKAAIRALRSDIEDYRSAFDATEALVADLARLLKATRSPDPGAARFSPLLASAVYERPRQAAEFLRSAYGLPVGHPMMTGLHDLDARINALRRTGESIIASAKELDRIARDEVEAVIGTSQAAIVIGFPIFLATGVTLLFLTTRNVVRRLRLLMDVMEQPGQAALPHVKGPRRTWGTDEVGRLIRRFDDLQDELEEREADVERQNRELLETKKVAAIGMLAAGVAHELNNPLNNICLASQVLVRELGGSAPPTVAEAASDIMGQTVRVKKIVGDLLEFARGREPEFREVDLNDLIRETLSRFRTVEGRVAFAPLQSRAADAVVWADPDQLERVFINLFENAVDATPGTGEVRVVVNSSETHVQVRVTDTGRGIPKEALEKIYEPFFTTKEKGTGLGLAIVLNIVHKHGSEIAVHSAEGKGTTFVITFPKVRRCVS